MCGRRCEVRGYSGVLRLTSLTCHLVWVLDTGGADGVAMGGCGVLLRGTEAAEEEMSSDLHTAYIPVMANKSSQGTLHRCSLVNR